MSRVPRRAFLQASAALLPWQAASAQQSVTTADDAGEAALKVDLCGEDAAIAAGFRRTRPPKVRLRAVE